MKNDRLDDLFRAVRRASTPTSGNGFTQRVLARLPEVPASSCAAWSLEYLRPSKNLYRVPTLATALGSVLILVLMLGSGFDYGKSVERIREQRKEQQKTLALPEPAWFSALDHYTMRSDEQITPEESRNK